MVRHHVSHRLNYHTNGVRQVKYVTALVDAVCAKEQGTFHRQTVKTGNTTTTSDVTLINLRRPDLTTFDDTNGDRHKNFQYAAAPWELKVKSSDAPDPESHKDIIAQVADVVRLRMASRPFQLFTLSLILCDSRFWVAMWDRDGVVVSRPHQLEEEQDLFRRIIISLHCHLDLYDLGLDRNVKIAAGLPYIPSDPYPTIDFGGHEWQLVERIFQSVTAIGRGTSVWRVRRTGENGEDIARAFKWSWRSPGRDTEAEIHTQIEGAFEAIHETQPLNIALMDSGASDSDLEDAKVDIQSLRSDLEETSKPVRNLVLTCILLKRVGKAIWDYKDDLEIMRGARDILQGQAHLLVSGVDVELTCNALGLVSLHDVGWMHRDISAGNCLLTQNEDDGPSFISDLELAKKLGSLSSGVAISVRAPRLECLRRLLPYLRAQLSSWPARY
jgi:hypothetical protein